MISADQWDDMSQEERGEWLAEQLSKPDTDINDIRDLLIDFLSTYLDQL